jgi:hypothetical protein
LLQDFIHITSADSSTVLGLHEDPQVEKGTQHFGDALPMRRIWLLLACKFQDEPDDRH